MTRLAKHASALVALGALLATPCLRAEPNAAQRATAEAMFQQATQLMDQQRYAQACEKFAASQELDPGLGTQLYLADCYDRAGRSASAWALFREVEDRARRANQADRERIARERAEALESKLSRLEVRVSAPRELPGLEVSLAGAAVPSASWNAALPVDPGTLKIEVRAPGHKTWTSQVKVAPGASQQVVEVPALAVEPRASRQPSTSPVHPEPPSSAQRAAGIVVGSAGLIGLAVGGFFGYRAYARNQESKGECRADSPNSCTPAGARKRDEASDAAKLSTIFTLSGVGLFATGVTLVLTAPSPSTEAARRGRANTAWGLELGGVW